MASTKDTDTSPKVTEQEARFFVSVFKHMEGKVQIDWANVAKETGYNSGSTAQTRFGQMKRRLGVNNSKTGASAANAPARTAKRAANAPASRVTKRTKRAKRAEAASHQESDDDEDSPSVEKTVKADAEDMELDIKEEINEV
ncbi:hypothetical protein PG996_004197 [Apiospora saccharicola]|uniref:Myb-like DNA-binding domain-containing protein n=1 Tax=Apiospora saccharicola TaxID=335842 RepID=A0ABR1W3L6_9PEZI